MVLILIVFYFCFVEVTGLEPASWSTIQVVHPFALCLTHLRPTLRNMGSCLIVKMASAERNNYIVINFIFLWDILTGAIIWL